MRKEAIALPTMWLTLAYITQQTAMSDVEFAVDKTPRTSEQLYHHCIALSQQARLDGVQLLEFTVYDGDNEMWRGLL